MPQPEDRAHPTSPQAESHWRQPMRAHPLLPGLVALLAIGCGDPNEPSPVNLRVRVSTVGVDQDSSYAVRTGDGSSHQFRTALSLFLSLGEHDVVLDQI